MSAHIELTANQRRQLGLPLDGPSDPIGCLRTTRARAQAWVWRHRVSLAIVIPLLMAVAAVRFWGVGHGPGLADDEGTYVAEAWAIQVKHTLAPYTYWYDHPPFGWLQIAGFTWLSGVFGSHGLAVVAVRRMMVGYAVVDGALLYLLARRLGIRRGLAGLGLLLWAVCPLAVGYSRMVYLDNIALPWALAAFVLAATSRRSLWAQVLAGLAFAGAVLSKETMILLLPALLIVVWQHTTRRTRAFCLTGFAVAGVLAVGLYPLMALLRGELLPGPGHVSLGQALVWQFFSRPSTGSALVPGTGSHTLLTQWTSLDGWLLLSGTVAGAVCLFVRRLRWLGVAMLVLVAIGLRPGYLPQPYVVAVLPFAALAAVGAVDALWNRLRQERPPVPVRPNAVAEARRRRLAQVALVMAGVLGLGALVPAWTHGDQRLADYNQSLPVAQAEQWLETHVRAQISARPQSSGHDVLVDDTVWADLATHRFPADRLIWFYKLDYVDNLDPSVRREVKTWKDFSYVVDSDIIRAGLQQTSPQTYRIARQAIAHSTVVAHFGTDSGLITIRRVTPSAGSSKG